MRNIDPNGLQYQDVPFGSLIPKDPFNSAYQRRDPSSLPTEAERECMSNHIRERWGDIGLKLIASYSVMSYFDNNGNLVDGGANQAWLDTAEIGGMKGGALLAAIHGSRFMQSAALTSEAVGMGGSASVGIFVASTKVNAAGHAAERFFKRISIPAAVLASLINADARDQCGCGYAR